MNDVLNRVFGCVVKIFRVVLLVGVVFMNLNWICKFFEWLI